MKTNICKKLVHRKSTFDDNTLGDRLILGCCCQDIIKDHLCGIEGTLLLVHLINHNWYVSEH